MRKRASSLLDKPFGTGGSGGGRGSTGAGVEDRLCGSGAVSAPECPDSDRCCSVGETEPCWVGLVTIGLKGVIVAGEPASMNELENEDRMELRLRSPRRRRTKTTAPITATTAAAPPMTPTAIAATCDGAAVDAVIVVVVALASIAKTGALQVEICQPRSNRGNAFHELQS